VKPTGVPGRQSGLRAATTPWFLGACGGPPTRFTVPGTPADRCPKVRRGRRDAAAEAAELAEGVAELPAHGAVDEEVERVAQQDE